MSKTFRKKFTVRKRFDVVVSTTIEAETFEAAVAELRKMDATDFLEAKSDTDLECVDELSGMGVDQLPD